MDKKQKSPKDNEEMDILICARTEDAPDVLKGSIWDKCRECKSSIWISLSGQRAMKQNKKLVPFCIACAYKKNPNPKAGEVTAAPGSLQELQKYLATRKKH